MVNERLFPTRFPRWVSNLRGAGSRAAVALALVVHFAPWASAQQASQYAAGDRIAGKVVSVEDGDTITVLAPGHNPVRVRVANIDAPEWDQPFGDRSKRIFSDLAFGKDADVAVDDVDSYQRPVGRIRVGGEDVNAALVRSGAAWVFTRYNRDPSLVGVEADARAARRGLWGLPENERQPPWEWRAAKREERERRRATEAKR
jgi:endonuclease YncB( thermonuclease family)